jgi:periplasmic divalent cation tolerance protein
MPTVYITVPPDAADDLAHLLVEERLAACVNRVQCDSVYRWNDEVIDEPEVILLAKTTDATYPALVERVREAHPYDVPGIERFDEADVEDTFATWLADSVASDP